MKRPNNSRRLRLHRETIHNLAADLQHARGGAQNTETCGASYCGTCVTCLAGCFTKGSCYVGSWCCKSP